MDHLDGYWKVKEENGDALITINDENHYKVISQDGKKLIVETVRNGLIYHYEKQW